MNLISLLLPVLLVLMYVQTTLGQTVDAQTFWIAVDNAQARSPLIQRQAAALRSAREADPQSLSKLLPSVNASASKTLDESTRYSFSSTNSTATSKNDPTQVGITVTQPIFNYVNLLERTQTIPHIDAAVADLALAQQDVVVRVATLTSNWLEAKEVYELSDRYLQVTARHAHVVRLRFKAGESTETEVHEADSRAFQAEASRANARNVMDKAAASFAEVVGEQPTPGMILPEFDWQEPAHFEQRLTEFVEERPDIRAARARMQEAEITTQMRRAEHAPSVRFTYTASHTWDAEQATAGLPSNKADLDNQSAMVLLDVPVFNGGMVLSRTRQAQADWESRVADVDRLRLLGVREAQEARMDMAYLQLQIEAQERALRSSQKALAGLRESFLSGTQTILELLDAQYEALTVQTNLVRSRYQHRLARIRLWAALGWPLIPDHVLTVVAERGSAQSSVTDETRITELTAIADQPLPPVATPTPVRNTAAQPVATAAAPADRPTPPPVVTAAAPADPPTQWVAEGSQAMAVYVADAPVMATLPPSPAAPTAAWTGPSTVGPAPDETTAMLPAVSAKTDPVLPESGRRPDLLPEPPPDGLPKRGWGPYYACVGIYPDEATVHPVESALTKRGVPSLVETVRTQDNRLVMRLLVGPFIDFTDLAQARQWLDERTHTTTGWVRNRKWTPQARPVAVRTAPAWSTDAPLMPAAATEPSATATGQSGFAASGPFYAEVPPELPPPAQGPWYPYVSEGPFYVHLGAFPTEQAREQARQQVAELQIPTSTGLAESQRDRIISPEGQPVHRLLTGPFDSYEEGLQAKRAIQKTTGILTGAVDDPRWEEHQHCPNENLLWSATPDREGIRTGITQEWQAFPH
ncbi:MAG: TolC family protein [Magnetococcales bacterium]|nr:TolC family protein [Magnetococcales bacterium]